MARTVGLLSKNQAKIDLCTDIPSDSDCDEWITITNLTTAKIRKLVCGLKREDRIILVTLSGWNLSEADLTDILKILHKAGIHFSTLDGLNLPPEKEGSNVLAWIEGLRKVRAAYHSHQITQALEKKPRQTRKIKDDQKKQFLLDSTAMTQSDLAKKYGVSIATIKNYLKVWKK